MSEIVIPTSAQEAEARLAELGPLATAVEWERAAIISALTKPGRSGPATSSGPATPIFSARTQWRNGGGPVRTAEARKFGFDLVDDISNLPGDVETLDGDPQDLEDPSDIEDWDDPEDEDALDHPAFELLDDDLDECPDCAARGLDCPYGADSEYR